MSILVSQIVWNGPRHITGSKLNVLLALAEWSDDTGLSWHSVADLAQRVRLCERATQYVLKQLQADGYLAIEEGRGRYNTSRYRVLLSALQDTEKVQNDAEKVQPVAPLPAENMPIKGAKSQQEKVQNDAEKVQNDDIKGAIAIAPEPSLTVKEPSVKPSYNENEQTLVLEEAEQNRGRASPKSPKKSTTGVPSDFEITKERDAWARAQGFRGDKAFLEFVTANFLDTHAAKGTLFKDWQRAWQTWIRNSVAWGQDIPKGGNSNGNNGNGHNGSNKRASGYVEAIAELEREARRIGQADYNAGALGTITDYPRLEGT